MEMFKKLEVSWSEVICSDKVYTRKEGQGLSTKRKDWSEAPVALLQQAWALDHTEISLFCRSGIRQKEIHLLQKVKRTVLRCTTANGRGKQKDTVGNARAPLAHESLDSKDVSSIIKQQRLGSFGISLKLKPRGSNPGPSHSLLAPFLTEILDECWATLTAQLILLHMHMDNRQCMVDPSMWRGSAVSRLILPCVARFEEMVHWHLQIPTKYQ